MKTPTAQLADYILPGDARGVYDLWRGLAVRLGLGEHFPWETNEDLLDYRVAPLGLTFAEFAEQYPYHMGELALRKYETTGFATPSGKVELASSILEGLGFDSLSSWRDAPPADPDWPLELFTGVREDPYFQTGHRFVPALRARAPEARMFLHADDAAAAGLREGDTAGAETAQGSVTMAVEVRDDMPKGLVRIPHGWWTPEAAEGDGNLSGAWTLADAQLCRDDPEQGIPCRVRRMG